MAKIDSLIEQLREMAGTKTEMAAALKVEASNATFRRAVKTLEEEGVLIPEGSTSDRRYRNSNLDNDVVNRALLDLLPCTAREFSDAGNKLGLRGTPLGDRRLALGIETVKAEDGRWHCRLKGLAAQTKTGSVRQARICPKCHQRQFGDPKWVCNEHGVAVDQVDMPGASPERRPDSEQFAHMAAKAGKGGRTIGARGKDS